MRKIPLAIGLVLFSVFLATTATPAPITHGVVWQGCAGGHCTGQTIADSALAYIVASRYSWGVGVAPQTANAHWDKKYIKGLNTSFRWLAPWSVSDVADTNSTSHAYYDSIVARAARKSWRLEGQFLHYVDSTRVAIASTPAETVWVQPWGVDSIGSRVLIHPELGRTGRHGRGRIATNAATTRAKQLWKELVLSMCSRTPYANVTPTAYPGGAYFDNASGELRCGTILAGGHVREQTAPRDRIDSAAFQEWYFASNIGPLMAALRDTFALASAWHPDSTRKYVVANIGSSNRASAITTHCADILFGDGHYSTLDSAGVGNSWVKAMIYADSAATARGMGLWMSPAPTRRNGAHSTGYSYKQQILSNYAYALLFRGPNDVFFNQGTTASVAQFDTLTWCTGVGIADLMLGSPVGKAFKVASGTDGIGNHYDVWARRYASGMVLVRNWGSLTERVGDNTAVTVHLNLYYRRIDPTGWSAEGSQRWVKIRAGEGVVLYGPVSAPSEIAP